MNHNQYYDDDDDEYYDDPAYKAGLKHHLFTYGTMKIGHLNHGRIMYNPFTRFLGEYTTAEAKFSMLVKRSIGYWAPVAMIGGRHKIHGELYIITGPMLHEVDLCENHPHLYKREKVQLIDFDKPVWMYLYQDIDMKIPLLQTGIKNMDGVLKYDPPPNLKKRDFT
jgi:gamma-glutamylcyclotransferase (GGCT)/AIG2-like uncharacterized protein YtfP